MKNFKFLKNVFDREVKTAEFAANKTIGVQHELETLPLALQKFIGYCGFNGKEHILSSHLSWKTAGLKLSPHANWKEMHFD